MKNELPEREAEAGDPLGELLATFARHGFSSAWPVSLRSYEQMRAAADDAVEERVHRERAADGEELLTLEAIAADARQSSIDTRLVVRERDLHPIEQRLTVREGSATTEFVVREKGFEVVSLATLPVAFFDAPSEPVPAAAEATIADGHGPCRRPRAIWSARKCRRCSRCIASA